jgi:iron-sulfur cluster insertion protein
VARGPRGSAEAADLWRTRSGAPIVPGEGAALDPGRRRGKDIAMIKITEKAAVKVKEIAEAESLLGQGLRLRVVGGGCSGFSYDLYFEDKLGEMDEEFESNGVKLYVDPMSYQYLEGVEIDYVEGLHGAGFKFNNPNSKGSCGCGSSFSA